MTVDFGPSIFSINPVSADTTKFQARSANTMAADVLSPCIARSSATMLLSVQNKEVLIFQDGGFQPPDPSSNEKG